MGPKLWWWGGAARGCSESRSSIWIGFPRKTDPSRMRLTCFIKQARQRWTTLVILP